MEKPPVIPAILHSLTDPDSVERLTRLVHAWGALLAELTWLRGVVFATWRALSSRSG